MLERDIGTPVPPSQAVDIVSKLNTLPEESQNSDVIGERFYLLAKIGQYDKALTTVEKFIGMLPVDTIQSKSGIYFKAIMLTCLNRFDDALRTMEELLLANPNNPRLLCGRGIILSKKGELKIALEDLSRSVEMQPTHVEAFEEKARVEKELGDETASEQTKKHASLIMVNRAKTLAREGESRQAIGLLCRAIQLNEKCWTAYIERSKIFFRVGMHQQSMEDLVTIISVSPKYCDAHLILAELHWKLNMKEKAIEIQTNALTTVQLQDVWRVRLARAEYLLDLHKNEEVIDDINGVLTIQPQHYIATRMKVIALRNLNRLQQSLELLLSVDPKWKDFVLEDHCQLKAMLYLRLEQNQKFVASLEELLSVNPKNAFGVISKVGDLLDTISLKESKGEALPNEQKEKQLTNALVILNGALSVNKEAMQLYGLKDSILQMLGRDKQAIELLNEACEKKESGFSFHKRRMTLLIKHGMVEQAMAALDVQAKRFPQKKFEVCFNHALILLSGNKFEMALKALEQIKATNKQEEEAVIFHIALCYGQMGQPNECNAYLQRISKDSTNWKAVQLMKGAAHVIKLNWQAALQEIEKVDAKSLKGDEKKQVDLLRMTALTFVGREKEAIELNDHIEDVPERHYVVGMAQLRIGIIPAAVKEFSVEIHGNKKHHSYFFRAVCFTLIRHFKEALMDVERAANAGLEGDPSYSILCAVIWVLTRETAKCAACLEKLEKSLETSTTFWLEFDGHVKKWLGKVISILKIISRPSQDEQRWTQACTFAMEIVKLMAFMFDTTGLERIQQLENDVRRLFGEANVITSEGKSNQQAEGQVQQTSSQVNPPHKEN